MRASTVFLEVDEAIDVGIEVGVLFLRIQSVKSLPIIGQANDPLVHYTVNDLTDPIITDRFSTNNVVYVRPPNTPLPRNNLGLINERYRPWGGGGQLTDINDYNFYAKDPLIVNSDAWQFPDNKFPGIGWLGRVHRGTSWQTMLSLIHI